MSAPKIEGKLSSKVLGDILRKLEQNRGAAYLLVSDGLSERCLYCSVGAIRLTSMGRRRAFRLEDKLLDHPRVTHEVVSGARAHAASTGESFEEVLSSRYDLNDVLKECSSAIVRDEVLDLLLWEGALFEYAESNPPPKIFDPRLEAVKLSLGASKLLKEAADSVGRTQKLLAKVTGRTLVTQGASWTGDEGEGSAAGAIVSAVPREGAVFDDVVLDARRAGYDAVQISDAFEALLDARRIDIPKKEKGTGLTKDAEQNLAKRDNLDIEAALEFIMNDLAARQRLAKNYMVLGDQARAVLNLKKVGDELFNRNKGEDAIEAYRQIVQLVPHDFGVREKIAFLFEKMRRMPEAIAEGVALANIYRKFGLFNRAKNAWRRVIGLDPQEVEHRKALIDLLVKLKEKGEAVQEFEHLAEIYKGRQDEEEVLGVYKHLLSIDPEHEGARALAQQSVRRSPGFWVPYAGVAAGFLLLLAAGAYVSSEYGAISRFKETRKLAFDRYDARDFDGAVGAVDDFLRVYGGSGAAARAETLKKQLGELETERRGREAETEYGRARELESKGLIPEARQLYASVVVKAKGTKWDGEAQARVDAIDRLSEDGERILSAVRRHESENNLREALDRGRELMRTLPWTEAAKRYEAKIRVVSMPPGARITVNGQQVPGATPVDVQGRASGPIVLTLTLAGFAPETRTIDVKGDVPFPLVVEMKRALKWRQTLLGPIEATPLADEDGVVIGGRDQRVYAFDLNGTLRWMRPLGLFADVSARPIRAGKRVIVGDRTGGVTALLDDAGGQVAWRAKLRGAASPVMSRLNGQVVVVADEDGAVVGLEGATGKERWRFRVPGGLAAAPTPIEADGTIVVPCGESMLVVLDASTGAEKARIQTMGRATAPVALTDKGFIMATEGDVLRSLSRDGKQAWQAKTPGAVSAQPLVADGAVFVGAGSSLLALDLLNGQERFPKVEYKAAIRTRPAARADRLYVATGDGALHALGSRTGILRWTYRTQGEITAEPVAIGDVIFLGSMDFGLYAIRD